MTITILKDSNNKIIKRNVLFTLTPTTSNGSLKIFKDILDVTNIPIGGALIPLDINELEYLSTTPGIIEANKIAISNSGKNIYGFNEFSCSKLLINNKEIKTSLNPIKIESPYLNYLVPGYSSQCKVISTNIDKDVKNLNIINTKNLNINDKDILYKTEIKSYSDNLIKNLNPQSNLGENFIEIVDNNTIIAYNNYISKSFDLGYSWEQIHITNLDNTIVQKMAYNDSLDLYIIIGMNLTNFKLLYSYNLTDWEETESLSISNSELKCNIIWAMNKFIYICSSLIKTSIDGINWINIDHDIDNACEIIWNGNLLIIINNTSDVYFTNDLINFEVLTVGNDNWGYASKWNNGIVLMGTNNLAFSNDTINWSLISIDTSLTRIKYNLDNNYFIGNNSSEDKIKLSYDGINWIDVDNNILNKSYNFEYSKLLSGFYNLQNTNQSSIINIKKIYNDQIEDIDSSLYNIQSLDYNIRDIQYSKSNNSFILISDGNIYSTNDMINFTLFINNNLNYDWSLFSYIDKYQSIIIVGDSSDGNILIPNLTDLDSNPFEDDNIIVTNIKIIELESNEICLTTSSNGTFYTIDGNISYSINNYSTCSPILLNNKIILLKYTTSASTEAYYIEKLSDGYSTEITTIPSGIYNSAAWSGLKCVAVGVNICAHTIDGINWVEHTIPNAIWTDIVWIDNLSIFVALNTNTTNCLSYSYDGSIWNIIETSFGGTYNYKKGLIYEPINNELYILGSYKLVLNKKIILNLDNYNNDKSSLFTGFENKELDNSNNLINWNSICYGYDLYILISTNKISYSSDLNNWSTITLNGDWKSISYGIIEIPKYIVVGTNLIASSLNGSSWSIINKTGNWKCICYGLSKFIIVGDNNILYSLDGINWNNISKSGNWKSISYNNNKFVAVGTNIFGYSNNGIIWNIFNKTGDWKSVYYNNNIFVAIGTNIISYSSDCINWIDINKTGDWKSITWSVDLNLFIIIGNGIMIKSADGINWIDIESENINYNDIIWSKRLGIFIIVGNNNKLLISNLSIPTIDNVINLDYTNNSLNLGIINNDEGLVIKSDSTIKLINSSHVDDSIELNADTNKLNINANIIDINNLSFNDIQLKSTGQDLNLLNTTSGAITNGTEVCVMDNNLEITNINSMSIDNILINDNILLTTSDNTNTKITSVTEGIASPNNVLITNSENNITEINNIKVNNLTIGDINITNNNLNLSNDRFISNIKSYNNYPSNIDINSIDYSPQLDLFVAVGNGINISIDGLLWKKINNIDNINNVYWDSYYEIFIASTIDGILISNNGINWDKTQSEYNWISTTSNNNGIIISISDSDKLMYTSDNITWNTITIINRNWTSITYGNNTFVAVGSMSTTTSIMYSNDGLNWVLPITHISKFWQYIYYSVDLNMFISVGNLGSIGISNNGIDWSYPTSPTINNHKCVKYWNNNLIIVSNNGANDRILKSSNGINWIMINTINIEINYKTISSNSIRIIFGGDSLNYDSTKISYTEDLINFELVCTNFDINFNDIIWISELNMFIAIGEKNKKIMYSYNGKDWNFGIIPLTNYGIYSICWSGSLLLATSYKYLYKSSDGINWIVVSNFINDNNYYKGCAYGNSKFIVINNSTNGNNIYYSNDAINWTGIEVSTKKLHNIIWSYNLSIFIITSENNILTSTNGLTWITNTNDLNSVYISEFNFLVVTTGSTLYKSSNGSTWNKINTNIQFTNLYRISYISQLNKYIGICKINNKSTFILSEDLINWDTYLCTINNNYNSILWSNNILITYGYTFNTPGYPFLTLCYEEYLNKLNTKNYESKLNSIEINDIESSLNNWKDYTNETYSFEGSVYWSDILGLFINTIGKNATLNSNNSLYYSKDGYTWESSTLVNRINKLIISQNVIMGLDTNLYKTNNLNNSWNTDSNTFNDVIYIDYLELYIGVSDSTSNNIKISKNANRWDNINISSSILFSCIGYSSSLIIALPDNGNLYITSENGYDWDIRTLPTTTGNWNSISWSLKLKMFIAVSLNGDVIKSINGIDWNVINLSNTYNRSSVIWVDDLEIYIITSLSNSTTPISYSYDSINWVDISFENSISIYSIAWSSPLKMFIINCGNGHYMLSKKNIIGINNLISEQNETNILFNYNQNNGNMGIGSTYSNYQLKVNGIAAKPSTSTWIVASDERIKENIVNADLDICYNIVKNLRLVDYKFKDNIQNNNKNKLGWIAQEVEEFLPKSVTISNNYGYEDCRGLDSDQIIAAMYGTIQKLYKEYEIENKELEELKKEILNL